MTKTPNGRLAALSLEIASASIFAGTARRYTSFDLSVGAAGFSLDPLHAKFALSIDDDALPDGGGNPAETTEAKGTIVGDDPAAGSVQQQAQTESSGTPQADSTDTGASTTAAVGDPPKDEQQQ